MPLDKSEGGVSDSGLQMSGPRRGASGVTQFWAGVNETGSRSVFGYRPAVTVRGALAVSAAHAMINDCVIATCLAAGGRLRSHGTGLPPAGRAFP